MKTILFELSRILYVSVPDDFDLDSGRNKTDLCEWFSLPEVPPHVSLVSAGNVTPKYVYNPDSDGYAKAVAHD